MIVALDTNPVHVTQAGLARYLRGLMGGLRELRAPDLSVFEFHWPVDNFGYRQPWRALKTAYREWVWANHVGPRLLRLHRANVLHMTYGLDYPVPAGVARVATLFDLAVLRQPDRFRRWHGWSARHRLPGYLKADAILCISRFTADEAMALLSIPAARLTVVPLASSFGPASPEAPPGAPVPDEFFLFVGSLEPGKNLTLLKQVWTRARAQGRPLPPLVIVGARWEGVPGEGAPPSGWIYLGRQPDAALVHLYRRARALVFPSRYEGFGLPVLEAMTLGCPVICSPVASLPEIAGASALYAEATPGDYLGALRRVLADANGRSALIAAGLDRARAFSWRACAEGTADVYRRVCR